MLIRMMITERKKGVLVDGTYKSDGVPVGYPVPVFLGDPKMLIDVKSREQRTHKKRQKVGSGLTLMTTVIAAKILKAMAVYPDDAGMAICDKQVSVHLGPRVSRRTEFGTGYRNCNSSPRAHGRSTIRALSTRWWVPASPPQKKPVNNHPTANAKRKDPQDTRSSSSKQDKQPNVQEDSNDGTSQLSDELVARFGTEEVTGLEVSSHVCSLGC